MVDQDVSRKLAVIVHADVVDSTALVQRSETIAHNRITEAFQRFSAIIREYGGSVHEIRGDALVAEFERTSDAVSAALNFQQINTESLKQFDDEIRPTIRIGASLGEVVFADGTVTGAGVILAQRVEQLAEPGGLCITAAIHEALPKHLPFHQANLGEQQLQGFDEPIRVYRVELKPGESIPLPEYIETDSSLKSLRLIAAVAIALVITLGLLFWFQPWEVDKETTSAEGVEFSLPDKPSIAVLPFTNISDDPQQEYFADGMTDDLITDLSNISGLLVIARNSVFVYKDTPTPVQQIARELGVRYLLEGSMRRAGDRLRINAQLIDGTTGGHLWAERYDESLDDIFALQDKVTRRIVTTLKIQLTPQEQAVTTGHNTDNVAAHDAFLQGWTHVQRRTPEDAVKAIPFFNEAIELDPNYSDAQAALAQIYWDYSNDENFNTAVDPGLGASFPTSGYNAYLNALKFLRNLQEARANPSPQAHMLAAHMLQRQRRFEEAMQEAKQAVALGPNNPMAYDALIENLIYAGEAEEALTLIDESIRLDPNVPGEKLFLRGMAYYTLGRLEDAVSSIDAARIHNPKQTRYAAIKAAALAELGQSREAEVALTEYLSSWTTYEEPELNWTMYYWPFQSGEALERLANNFITAGLPIPVKRYYLAASQDRLTGDEIESLLSNKTMKGGNRGYYTVGGFFYGDDELEVIRDEELKILSQSAIKYFEKGGQSRVENDLLCDPWNDLGDYCVAIYRNPDGTQEAKNEYLFFTFMSTYSFSVFDSN
ncbi:MAG: adenylate/guanylate cyclase domain-containing protein [Arenicellales bacterium]|nr:adenylate/guanylate cyclase domain-containing protein [Arenicellales bacterium]